MIEKIAKDIELLNSITVTSNTKKILTGFFFIGGTAMYIFGGITMTLKEEK